VKIGKGLENTENTERNRSARGSCRKEREFELVQSTTKKTRPRGKKKGFVGGEKGKKRAARERTLTGK